VVLAEQDVAQEGELGSASPGVPNADLFGYTQRLAAGSGFAARIKPSRVLPVDRPAGVKD